jgi:hypothetical protein
MRHDASAAQQFLLRAADIAPDLRAVRPRRQFLRFIVKLTLV